jgi:hypothetical protein
MCAVATIRRHHTRVRAVERAVITAVIDPPVTAARQGPVATSPGAGPRTRVPGGEG